MKLSAGILVYRRKNNSVEVLLVHPGGPFWVKKDFKSWGLVKGEFSEGEEPMNAAKREFKEELGLEPPSGEYMNIGTVKIPSKIIHGWAVESDPDISNIKSNLITLEWPPKSGQKQEFPEVDRAEWFEISKALPRMHTGQDAFLQRLIDHLGLKLERPEQSSLF